ncbi:hypothetical protein FACS1894177_04910 [Bacteroidia bacterium]|nr:hypothetical protein FACS1894177_04910 [Bacteroidia bacterium]
MSKMNTMQANNNLLTSIDDIMDAKYGKEGTSERESFRKEAYAYYMGQILHDVRKSEKVTQQELASHIGANKSYISKIERMAILSRR